MILSQCSDEGVSSQLHSRPKKVRYGSRKTKPDRTHCSILLRCPVVSGVLEGRQGWHWVSQCCSHLNCLAVSRIQFLSIPCHTGLFREHLTTGKIKQVGPERVQLRECPYLLQFKLKSDSYPPLLHSRSRLLGVVHTSKERNLPKGLSERQPVQGEPHQKLPHIKCCLSQGSIFMCRILQVLRTWGQSATWEGDTDFALCWAMLEFPIPFNCASVCTVYGARSSHANGRI